MSLDVEIHFDEAQIAKLLNIPLHLRLAPAERVLKAMAKPVVAKAKSIAPSSTKTSKDGRTNREKEGKNVTAKFIGRAANSVDNSGKHIGYVYRKTERGGYLVIGGQSPKANKLNYDASEKRRRHVLWGKSTLLKIKRIPPSERFMQKAADETREQQISAGNKQLEKELRELNLG